MSFYADRVLPRIVDLALSGREFDRVRARVASGLSGEVVEVGWGSGRNVPHYPAEVTRVLAVEPAALGRRLGAGRLAASAVPVEFVGLDGQDLPLADESADHILTTWTLCTIPDVMRALGEMRRVLKPGGTLHFVEHGLAPDARVRRWQNRLTPVQKRLFGGCHLNRPIDTLITDAGLSLDQLAHPDVAGPKTFGYLYEGVASKPAA